MRKMNVLRFVLFLTIVALLSAGCAKKPAPAAPAPAPAEAPVTTKQPSQEVIGIQKEAVVEEPASEVAPLQEAAELTPQPEVAAGLQPIYFDLDQHVLTLQSRDTLAANASYLKARPELEVRIDGHCDERGSDEYNLALGERRAQAARDFLISLGVSASTLSTLSYGEERPVDPGHNETAWAKNRRAEFRILP